MLMRVPVKVRVRVDPRALPCWSFSTCHALWGRGRGFGAERKREVLNCVCI